MKSLRSSNKIRRREEHWSKPNRQEKEGARRGPGSLLLAFLETRGRRLLAVIVGDESVEAIDRHFPIGRHHVVDRNTGNLARESDRRRGEGIYGGIGSREEGGHRRRRAKKRG